MEEPGKKASPEIFKHGEILITNGMSSQSSSSPITFIQQTCIRLLLCSLPFQIFPLPWLCGQQRFVFPPIWLVLSEGITNFPLFFESKWIPPFFSLTLITFLYISITTTSHPLSIALPHSIYVVFFLPLLTASSITTPWRQNYLCSACISGAGLIPGMNVRLNT